MSIENLEAIASAAPLIPVLPQANFPAASAPVSGNFGNMVTQGLESVNQQLQASQVDLQQLAVGNVENLHQIMIRMEESRLSFQLMMQVRNRLLEAYQDVMRMQV